MAEALLKFTGAEVTLYVHTDAGAADAATSTQAQADALKAYLVNKGVPARRVTAAGRGSEEPVDKKHPERNRRVEIEIANP